MSTSRGWIETLAGPLTSRILLVLCALALAWASVVVLTGGFVFHAGSLRVASRSPLNTLLLALVCAAAAVALAWSGRLRALRAEASRWLDPALLVAMVGTGLLAYQWGVARPLWLDEQMIALNIRERTLADMAGGLWLGQSAPFGWLAAERAMVLLLGDGERAMRLVPVAFGAGLLAAALWIGHRWMGTGGAALLVLLCSFGQWLSFYSLELKHYSADLFFALLLPAAAAWAAGERPSDRAGLLTRAAAWWGLAAFAQWLANGALLVTPGCALVLFVLAWRRGGWRAARTLALYGVVWLASLGLHYQVAIRHALNDPFLGSYWTFAFPPSSSGLAGTAAWLAGRLHPFAVKPGGTGLWLLFWMAAACGLALTRHRVLGMAFAAVPVSAFILAAFRLVPFFERLSLWVVPSLYVGVALLFDVGMRLGRNGYLHRSAWRLAAAAAITAAPLALAADIIARGNEDRVVGRPPGTNHQLDDRTGVRWIFSEWQPGDVLVTTHLALPAIWWYGRTPPADGTSRLADGTPVVEVGFDRSLRECSRNELRARLEGRSRALVYFGFRFDDVPGGFDDLLLEELSELGAISAVQRFSKAGSAAIVELRAPSGDSAPRMGPTRPRPLAGCVTSRPATRW